MTVRRMSYRASREICAETETDTKTQTRHAKNPRYFMKGVYNQDEALNPIFNFTHSRDWRTTYRRPLHRPAIVGRTNIRCKCKFPFRTCQQRDLQPDRVRRDRRLQEAPSSGNPKSAERKCPARQPSLQNPYP